MKVGPGPGPGPGRAALQMFHLLVVCTNINHDWKHEEGWLSSGDSHLSLFYCSVGIGGPDWVDYKQTTASSLVELQDASPHPQETGTLPRGSVSGLGGKIVKHGAS